MSFLEYLRDKSSHHEEEKIKENNIENKYDSLVTEQANYVKKQYKIGDINEVVLTDLRTWDVDVKLIVTNNDETKFKDLTTGEIFEFNDRHSRGKARTDAKDKDIRKDRIRMALDMIHSHCIVKSKNLFDEIKLDYNIEDKIGLFMKCYESINDIANELISERDCVIVKDYLREKYIRQQKDKTIELEEKRTREQTIFNGRDF